MLVLQKIYKKDLKNTTPNNQRTQVLKHPTHWSGTVHSKIKLLHIDLRST